MCTLLQVNMFEDSDYDDEEDCMVLPYNPPPSADSKTLPPLSSYKLLVLQPPTPAPSQYSTKNVDQDADGGTNHTRYVYTAGHGH